MLKGSWNVLYLSSPTRPRDVSPGAVQLREVPSARRLAGAAGGVVSGSSRFCSANCALRRRPVTVLKPRKLLNSPLSRSAERRRATVMSGRFAHRSAATPATCGEAIEVPLKDEYVLPGVVLRMFSPG